MKKFLISFIILTIFCFAKCEKDKSDIDGLPAATQEGKNTFGFLLNGQPWTPKGEGVIPNLAIGYDQRYNQGILSIVAYNYLTPSPEQFGLSVRDSLNFMNAPVTLSLSRESLYSNSYNTPCNYFSKLSEVTSSGSLTITKLDRINRVISGTFNATLSRNGCPTQKITEGRFDMKF